MSAFGGKADIARSRFSNLASDLESSRERLATCCQPHGNQEGPTFLSVSIGRRESRPSRWLGWGVFSPSCRIRSGPLVSPVLYSCSSDLPKGSNSPEKTARTKLFARIDSLRTSSGPDRCCMYSRSFFAALGLCARHEKVPPQHLASRYHRDRPRPDFVRVS